MEFRRGFLLFLIPAAVGIIVLTAFLAALLFDFDPECLFSDEGLCADGELSATSISLTIDRIRTLQPESHTQSPLETINAVGTQAARQTATVSTTPSPNPTPPAQ
jgi:hypothetical protein